MTKATTKKSSSKKTDSAILATRAVLVHPTLSTWSTLIVDESVSEEVEKQNKADRLEGKVGVYMKRLLAGKEVDELRSVTRRIRATHRELTLPWNSDGVGVLTSACYMEYMEKMRELQSELDGALHNLVNALPTLKAKAKRRLGNMFREEDYPTPERLRGRFRFRVLIMPFPAARDLRVKNLQNSVVDELRAKIETDVQDKMTELTREAWSRLYDAVERLRDRLASSDAVLRDSVVESVADMCDLIPRLNVGGDERLDKMAKDIRGQLKYKGSELREDDVLRKQAAAKAEKLVKAMAGFMGTAAGSK